ncbi:MAG TPA: tRNA (adenosine(37)-N6)-threonylcarbamoyltransferase complex ATPase subunit type 1 TsaE [Deltaproteobacteria bacterium]|nr:tRNA (adenosine(37)-N6)-threonylcarbamoyltransferase complex ATPase subunit type 1 TsaE [Deltaproteobacteria bacterium]
MSVLILRSKSLEDTLRIGRIIGEKALPGMVIALVGDLGSGKTSLTQGIAVGLEVPDEYYVTSPSFTLVNEYPGRLPLYHFDVYRLAGPADLDDLGYDDYVFGAGLTAVEWAEKIMDRLPEDVVMVKMKSLSDEERAIELSSRSNKSFELLKKALKEGGFA